MYIFLLRPYKSIQKSIELFDYELISINRHNCAKLINMIDNGINVNNIYYNFYYNNNKPYYGDLVEYYQIIHQKYLSNGGDNNCLYDTSKNRECIKSTNWGLRNQFYDRIFMTDYDDKFKSLFDISG